MPPLYFTQPGFLWGLALPLVPLAIHLLKRRKLPVIPFPALRFLLASQQEQKKRQRLRELLVLACRMLLFACLPLAMAGPTFEKPPDPEIGGIEPRAVAFVLDTSVSMRLADDSGPLFDRAQREALALLSRMAPGEVATVVLAGAEPTNPFTAPTGDLAKVRASIEKAEPSFGTAALATAIQLAVDQLERSPLPKRELIILSDFRANSARGLPGVGSQRAEAGTSLAVTLVPLLKPDSLPFNSALATVTAEPAADAGQPGAVRFSVTAFDSGPPPADPRPVLLELAETGGRSGREANRGVLTAEAGAATAEIHSVFAEPGVQGVTLGIGPDALDADNRLSTFVHVPPPVRVLLINGAPRIVRHRDELFYLDAALQQIGAGAGGAAGALSARTVTPESMTLADLTQTDVVVAANVKALKDSLREELRRFVEAGGGLFITVGDETASDGSGFDTAWAGLAPVTLRGVREPDVAVPAARFGDEFPAHPIWEVFRGEGAEGLRSATFQRYFFSALAGPDDSVLASFSDGSPAFVEGRRGQGRVVVFLSSIDRDWNDWAVRTSFLPGMQRLLLYLGRALTRVETHGVFVGQKPALKVDLAAGDWAPGTRLALRDEQGTVFDASLASDGGLDIPDAVVKAPGLKTVYRVLDNGARATQPEAALSFAVNIDPAETTSAVVPPAEITAQLSGQGGGVGLSFRVEGEAQARDLAPHTILLALCVLWLLLESLLSRMPVTAPRNTHAPALSGLPLQPAAPPRRL